MPHKPVGERDYYLVPEVCERMGTTQTTLYEMMRVQQKPPHIRIGRVIRIPKVAFDKWWNMGEDAAQEERHESEMERLVNGY